MRDRGPTRPSVMLTTGSRRAASFNKDATVTSKTELLSNPERNPTQLPCPTKVLRAALLSFIFTAQSIGFIS